MALAWAHFGRRVVVAAAFATAFCVTGPANAQKSTLTFGSTNATSSNYALAVGMSKVKLLTPHSLVLLSEQRMVGAFVSLTVMF